MNKNLFANFAGRFWAIIFNLLFVPIYIKILGMEAYGIIGVFVCLQSILTLTDLGITATLTREVARLNSCNDLDVRMLHYTVYTLEICYLVILSIIPFIIFCASSFVAYRWFHSSLLKPSEIKTALQIMGFTISCGLACNFYQGGLAGLQSQVYLNMVLFVSSLFRALLTIFSLLWVSPSLKAFMICQLISGIVQFLWARQAFMNRLPLYAQKRKFDLKILRSISKYATGMLGMTITSAILTQSDKIILSKLLPLQMLGYYSLSWNIAQITTSVFSMPVFSAVFPKLTQFVASKNLAQLIQNYHLSAQIVSVLVASITAVLCMFCPQCLFLWLGNSVNLHEMSTIVILLEVGMAFLAIMIIPYALQLAYGWTKLCLTTNIAMILLYVPTLVVLAFYFNARGAAFAWLLLNLVSGIVIASFMYKKLLTTEFRYWLINDVAKPFLGAYLSAVFFFFVLPHSSSRVVLFFLLGVVWVCTLIVSIIFAETLRKNIFRILSVKFDNNFFSMVLKWKT